MNRNPAAAPRKSEAETLKLLRQLPKVDLHCHLDGSLRAATVLDLARRFQVKLPADNVKDLLPHVQVATCGSLKQFLDAFALLYPLLRHPDAVERIAYELVEDCAAENVRHVEVRLAPGLQATAEFPAEAVIEAVLKGLVKGLRDFGTTSSVIVCLYRSLGPQENRRTFEIIKRFAQRDAKASEPSVVGLDLAGDEARYPTVDFADFFAEAAKLGISTTCHAGETKGTANLSAALKIGVMRIGHGIHLIEDGTLMAEVVRRRVPLEIGISSNVRTGAIPDLKDHPALVFHRVGIPISINTDDRGILGIDLTHEYGEAHKLGFSLAELGRLSFDSVDHLFLPPAERSKLRSRFAKEIEAILEEANETL